MNLQRLLRGDPGRNSLLYLGIGVISLMKALAVRDDSARFRRELLDAGLFIGVGLALRRYSTMRAQKRAELEEQLPNWIVDAAGSTGSQSGLRTRAKRRLTSRTKAEPRPTLGDRARRVLQKR
ncbi:hypothetical protein HALLA_19245 [Halostagnicola larsenii XH-48]|uniref:Uncharacterized protein n=1 Tax=Halostagnicola larsenii XH-48 TaxID=797299 RepID=W0JU84_9EURY|nr:hypothetical protein [Halostagnicola larsenii]AHG00608.1 hypothetical protein HALLA_19245 [Halostagnicola larsenii XH-48]